MIDRQRIGVAVVGLGVGERHARAFAVNPHCEVRIVCDLSLDLARRLAENFSDCRATNRFEDFLHSTDIDVVVVASFDDMHYSQVTQALLAGKHVLVEKPMCVTLEELADIKRVWSSQSKPLILRSNLVLRAAPYYGWLRSMVQEGEVGDLYSIDGDYLYGRLQKLTEGWRGRLPHYSVMDGGGLHIIDLMIWISGQRPTFVTTHGNKICSSGSTFRNSDYMSATLEFDSGMLARVTANFGCVHRHQHSLRVFGTKATALYDDAGPRLHTSRDPADLPLCPPLPALPSSKSDLIPSFVDAVLANRDDSIQTQSYFDSIAVSIAATRALMTRNRERIEYV